MSYGITIEKGEYAVEIINYSQREEFYEFFSQFGEIEECKRYFYSSDVMKELIKFLRQYSENPLIEFLIKCLEEEIEEGKTYMVYFSWGDNMKYEIWGTTSSITQNYVKIVNTIPVERAAMVQEIMNTKEPLQSRTLGTTNIEESIIWIGMD